jgi:broad specificity phosphatase PhoE
MYSAHATRTPVSMPHPRWLRAALVVGGLVLGLGFPDLGVAQGERTVVLVRHAEKAAEPANDPSLSDEGRERAEALLAVLADARVGAVVVSPFNRTRETAAPVLRANDLTAVEVPIGRDLASHIQAVADAVRARPPGETVLVVGHSNTIPAIVTALGGLQLADLCDHQYAVLYVLSVPVTGPARLVQATYGAPDSSDPACPTMH